MSAQNESAQQSANIAQDKGKGKATEAQAEDVSMGEEETSDEEVDETTETVEEPDEDNMEEIDTDNIIAGGRRTRGRQIDFAKAAEEMGPDDDEDEDDDFVAPEDKMED